MRLTHFVPLRGSKIDIVREVLPELGIRNDCQLYAHVMRDSWPPTIILSAIPPKVWDRAYKLVVYLSGKRGSLSRAADLMSEVGLNIFASWTAATNAAGEGCWTSVAELPPALTGAGLDEAARTVREKLAAENLLSRSPEYLPDQQVLLRRVSVLANMARDVAGDKPFVGTVKDYYIDLTTFRTEQSTDASLYGWLRNQYVQNPADMPQFCLITPDTEERYIRLSFLPRSAKMVRISMLVRVTSPSGDFRGYFSAVLKGLAELGFNMYAADNFMLRKTADQPGRGSSPEEAANFVFHADAQLAPLCAKAKNLREVEEQIRESVKQCVSKHALSRDPQTRASVEKFEVMPEEALSTRCFFATNARCGDVFAQKTITTLRGLRLEPLNVDIARRPYSDATALLRASAMVVSLHLGTPANALQHRRDGKTHCPSDWVLFEEAYAEGLGRAVFRLLHSRVREPQYARGDREFSFADEQDFEEALGLLVKAISRYQTTSEYEEAVRTSDREAARMPVDILRRDMDAAYFGPVVARATKPNPRARQPGARVRGASGTRTGKKGKPKARIGQKRQPGVR